MTSGRRVTIFDSKENVDILKKMYSNNIILEDIANHFSVSKSHIYRTVKKLKLPNRKHITIFDFKKNIDKLKKMWANNIRTPDIAKHFDVSNSYIERIVKRLKLPKRKMPKTEKQINSLKNWNNSPEGKSQTKKWNDSPKGKSQMKKMQKDWNESLEGKANIKKIGKNWNNSIEGKANSKKCGDYIKEWRESSEGKERMKKWRNSLKGKAHFMKMQKEWNNSPKNKAHIKKIGEDWHNSSEGKEQIKKMQEDWNNSLEGKAHINKLMKDSKKLRITNPQLCLYYYLKILYTNIKLEYDIEDSYRWADVYDVENKIDYEFDGIYWHKDNKEKDFLRDLELAELGITVVRFRTNDVKMFAKFGEPFLDTMKRSIVD